MKTTPFLKKLFVRMEPESRDSDVLWPNAKETAEGHAEFGEMVEVGEYTLTRRLRVSAAAVVDEVK